MVEVPGFLQRSHKRDFAMPADLDDYAPKPRNGGNQRLTSKEMEDALGDLAQSINRQPRGPETLTPLQTIATMICELRYAEHVELATGLSCDPAALLKWAAENKAQL